MKIKTFDNSEIEIELPINLKGNLLALPALIDPHVHFRTPGMEHKENWESGSRAAFAGGVTTVLDMPNNLPPMTSAQDLENKKKIIDKQLRQAGVPLRYGLYWGATATNYTEFKKIKNQICAVKVFMGSSTGTLMVDKQEYLEKIFMEAARLDLLVAVHAEDEDEIRKNKEKITEPTVFDHSQIRGRMAASKAVKRALELAKKFGTKLYICHISTIEEIDLIREAKKRRVKVYAEVTPHHLFLNNQAYSKLGSKAQINPPLRSAVDQEALWKAINEGVIDTIGTDHAPHTLEEKAKRYPNSPSGMPGIETCSPLLLDAYNNGKITLQKIVELTRINPQKIFNLPENKDWAIVDLDLIKEVQAKNLKTKCGWSAWEGKKLKGWPIAVKIDRN